MKRRSIMKLGAVSILSSASAKAKWSHNILSQNFPKLSTQNISLSRMANRTTNLEGIWSLTNIEGVIPKDLKGSLFRVGPGQKKNHKTQLNHYFDGDAYLQEFKFSNGNLTLQAGFIETEQRRQELNSGKMLFDEFGTEAPKRTRKRKNNPNINTLPWGNKLLALSEGGHPSLIDPIDHRFIEYHDFNGTLPSNVGLSAHPKTDPKTLITYGFGIKQGITKSLMVYEMNSSQGTLKELYNLPQKKVFMVHDMMITENYLVFIIPPAYFKLSSIIFDTGSMADALRFEKELGSQLIILDKSGLQKPRIHKIPGNLNFHHGNCYEDKGDLVFNSFMAKDASLLDHIARWHLNTRGKVETSNLFHFRVDIKSGLIKEHKEILKNHDFPTFDKESQGSKQRYLYCAKGGDQTDLMRFRGVTKVDLETHLTATYEAKENEALGEAYFHNTGKNQYLFVPGYDRQRDESFLEILNSKTMQRISRVWQDGYFPLGFHACFMTH